jgi:hypothetical protein
VRHPHLHRHAVVVWILILAAVALVATNPQVLAPAATRVLNRLLLAGDDGELKVRAYHLRPGVGVDLYDVSLTLTGDDGGLSLIAADTLELDFQIPEVLGPAVRLRRAVVRGLEVYHTLGPPDDAAQTPGKTAKLPRLRADVLAITDARIEVARHDGRAAETVSSLSLRGAVDSDGRVLRVAIQDASVTWDSRAAVFEDLHGNVVADSAGVRTEGLAGVFNEGRVHVRGGQQPGKVFDLDVVTERVATREISALTGINLEINAEGALAAHVHAAADTVRFTGVFSGNLEGWQLSGTEAEAVITRHEVRLPYVRGRVGGAWFDGTVLVTNDPDGAAVVLIEGDASDLDISHGLIPNQSDLPHSAGRGRLRILHHEADRSTLVTGRLADGEIAIMPFDSAWVEVWATEDSLAFRRIDLRHRSILARLTGRSDRDKVFSGLLDVTADDLADLPAGWGFPALRGRVEGQGALHGALDDLNLGGQFRLGEVGLGPLVFGDGEAAVVGLNVLGDDWAIETGLDGRTLILGGVDLGAYSLRGRSTPTEAFVDSFVAGRGDTLITLTGSAVMNDDSARLRVDDLRIDFGGNTWRSTGPIEAIAAAGYVEIPALHLESDQGVLAGELEYATGRRLYADVVFSQFDMRLLHPFVPEAGRVGGVISARARFTGTPEHPIVEADGILTGADFPLAYVDSLAVRGTLRGGTVVLDDVVLRSEFGRVVGRGTVAHPGAGPRDFWPGADLDLELVVADGDWAFLDQFHMPALDRLSGRVEGTLQVRGTTSAPAVTGDLVSTPLNIHWLHLDELRGTVYADSSRLVLGDLRGHRNQLRLEGELEIPLRLDFLSEPTAPLDGPFHARVVVPPGSDLTPLTQATNAFIESHGTGEVEILIDGPLAHPLYRGGFTVRDGGFVLRDTEEILHDVTARGRFDGDVLYLEELRGLEGQRGTVAGAGTVTFRGLKLTGFDVRLAVDRFLLASVPDLRALLRSDNAAITSVSVGPDSTLVPKFTGDFDLIRGRYTGVFGAEPGAVDPTVATVAPAWLADVNVVGPPRSARILNRTMELDMSGDVKVVRDESGMYMLGRMDIDGGVMPVFNNTFKVVRGRLDFSREVGITPQIDLDAETRVRLRQPDGTAIVERLTVYAAGPLDKPEITYGSESGYPREAIERMLVGLAPYPDLLADQGALAQASLGAGMNLLEREIAGEIGFFDTVDLEQIQRQQEGSSLSIDPLVGLGKYIGSDFYVKAATAFTAQDLDVVVEYQINNHLLLQTEIRSRNDEYEGANTYNLDLKYRFEY